jgi:hypothetical protein
MRATVADCLTACQSLDSGFSRPPLTPPARRHAPPWSRLENRLRGGDPLRRITATWPAQTAARVTSLTGNRVDQLGRTCQPRGWTGLQDCDPIAGQS